MGIAGDLLFRHRDPDWCTPRFVRSEFDQYYRDAPRCGWANSALCDQQAFVDCSALVIRLNDMPDRAEALRIARAHPWFYDPKKDG